MEPLADPIQGERRGPWAPVTFDLTAEEARLHRANVGSYGVGFGFALALGAFALLGAIFAPLRSSWQGGLAVTAVLFLLLGGAGLYYTFVGDVVGIRLADDGLTVQRTHRPPLTLAWSDRRLGIVVTELTAPSGDFFATSDLRYQRPQWLFISAPIRGEVWGCPEIAQTLAQWAEGHGVSVERSPALIWAVTSPRSVTVTLAARKIPPGDTTVPNGRLTLIGPAARSN